MLNMTQINLIRDLAKSGYKISEIHEMTKTDPKTITKYLEKDDFSPEPPIKIRRSSIVAPFHDKIMEYLEEDKKHWSKQRHTAKRIFERLRDEEGYLGSYDTVQKYVQNLLVFDNATGVGRRICEKVMETELFSRFRAHYGFQIRFCNPQAGWENGSVENKVGTIRRNLFVPNWAASLPTTRWPRQ